MHELQYESCPLRGKQNELPRHKVERQRFPPRFTQEMRKYKRTVRGNVVESENTCPLMCVCVCRSN